MENCLKRRDHVNGGGVEDRDDSDLESDFQVCLLSGESYRRNEYECSLVSPYKRLRVEDLTHTSAESSQAGEGEAHSLLRTSDDDVYSENHPKPANFYSAHAHQKLHEEDSNQIRLSLQEHMEYPHQEKPESISAEKSLSDAGKLNSSSKTSNGNLYESLSNFDELKSSGRVSETNQKVVHSGENILHGLINIRDNKTSVAAPAYNWPLDRERSIPYIDEICLEKSPSLTSPPSASEQIGISVLSSRTGTSDYKELNLSGHQDFQTLESGQFFPQSDLHTLDLKPITVCDHSRSHQLVTNYTSADSHQFKLSSMDLLEVHAGDMITSEDDAHSCQSSSLDREEYGCDDEGHYETDDLNVARTEAGKHSEEDAISSRVNTFEGAIDTDKDADIPEAWKNGSAYFTTSQSRSTVTNRWNSPSHTRKTTNATAMDIHEDTEELMYVYDAVDSDHNMETAASTSKEAKSVVSTLLKTMAHSGQSTAATHLEICNVPRPNMGLKYNPHDGLTSQSRCVDANKSSTWDNAYQQHQEQYLLYQQGLKRQQQVLERQHSTASSIKSYPSITQSYHFDTLQVCLPRPPQDEHDCYPSDNRDSASSSASSRYRSRGDIPHTSHEGFSTQQHSGFSKKTSTSSSNHNSGSSQTSTDLTEKSYPRNVVVSGQTAKKAVLQSSGHLKISVYWNVGHLTIHVIQARCLSSSWKSQCDSYVKMSLVPDESRRTRCKTRIHLNNNCPIFDEKFSLEIFEEDRKKRLLLSAWHKDPNTGASEFLGCMSFGMGHLLKKDVNGWYYLLTEEVGRKKHLQANSKVKPVLQARSNQNIPEINRAFDGQEKVTITVTRGKNGFGFTFIDEFPPKVGKVDGASPAEQAGVKKGDLVIRINGQNVSRSTCKGVAHLVKKMNPSSMRLELLRDHTVSTTAEVIADTQQQQPHHPSSYKRGVGTSTGNLYESSTDRPTGDHHKENRTIAGQVNGSYDDYYYSDDELTYSQSNLPNHRVTSTPRLLVGASHKTTNAPAPKSLSKHEAIHRLMSLELEYIDFMHYGMERYSRPLRHSILSAHQHMTVFQNVEKLVTISEYHIKQMQENNSSVNSDTDDSQSSESSMFPNSVALIYHSKIHMLSQAYEAYASGLAKSNLLLRELRKNRDFMHFVKESDSTEEQCPEHLSVSAFINRPISHIKQLYNVLSEIFTATPLHSTDFANLQQIVIKLSHCISSITGLSTAGRVESLDSLTSSQGKTGSQYTSSGKGSMASLSSTCSSSDASARCPLVPAISANSYYKDMLHIQEMLVFAPNVQTFQLVQEGRYLIYQGEVYMSYKGVWFKSRLMLFSDILLLVTEEQDGSLCVTIDPISIQDLAGMDFNQKYASEFVLYIDLTPTFATLSRRYQSSAKTSERIQTITLRAPSTQEKIAWKSILQQHVTASSGSRLNYFSSKTDTHCADTVIV